MKAATLLTTTAFALSTPIENSLLYCPVVSTYTEGVNNVIYASNYFLNGEERNKEGQDVYVRNSAGIVSSNVSAPILAESI